MLILARKAGEGIQIGTDVAVYVVEIRGKQVRLGIEAPADTPVHRTEVYMRILEENRQAAAAPADLDKALQVWAKGEGESGATSAE